MARNLQKSHFFNSDPPNIGIVISYGVLLFISFLAMFFFISIAHLVYSLGYNIVWVTFLSGVFTFLALRAFARWSEPGPVPMIARITFVSGVAWPLFVFIASYIFFNRAITQETRYNDAIFYKIGIIGLAVPIVLALSRRAFDIAGGSRTTAIGIMAAFLTDCASILLTMGSDTGSMSCGRPYRIRNKQSFAQLSTGTAWASLPVAVKLPEEPTLREALGHAWLADARSEHASIAAFARLTQQLLAVGAPPDLLTQVSQAAADEVRHAEICFSLARQYTGSAVGATIFPEALGVSTPRELDGNLRQLAVEALLDGCLNEGRAAAEASLSATATADPALRSLLQTIAADEDRHAELAWSILKWVLRVDRDRVAPSLTAAMAALPEPVSFEDPLGVVSAEYRSHGRLGAAERESLYVKIKASVLARLQHLLQAP